MTRVVWVLPVGLEFERVLASLNEGGKEFYVFYSDTDEKVGKEAQRFAEQVKDYLEAGPFEVKGYEGVDVLDLSACISAFNRVLESERQENDDFVIRINIGTSSKIMALAALYVASRAPDLFELYYPRTRKYLIMDIVDEAEGVLESVSNQDVPELESLRKAVDRYRELGWTARSDEGYEMESIPIIPMQELSKTQQAILKVLSKSGGEVESSGVLARDIIDTGLTEAEGLEGARSSVSFALGPLKDWKFVRTETEGRKKRVLLTQAGRLYHDIFLSYPSSG